MNSTTRRRLQRGVIVLPSAFTLGNLFLGVWAIVSAARGHYETAGWLIVLAAFADLFDGRVARFTGTGSEFGEQLDSLVDAISFGVAPALVIYFAFLGDGGGWNWTVSFIYITAAVIRLARFNVEQAGTAKLAFHGLPSPISGVTLATYYAFTQTPLFRTHFSHVDAAQVAVWLTLLVGGLMVSNVLYAVVPRLTVRTPGGAFALFMSLAAIVAAFTFPHYFFFPVAVAYIAYGLLRTVVLGFLERLPERDPLLDEDEEDDEGEVREYDYENIRPRRRFRRRRPRTPEDTL